MTIEEIMAMTAGHELDVLVAEKVMGEIPWQPYHFSTDMSDAWKVVEKMRERIFSKRRVFLDNLQDQTRYIGTVNMSVAWPDVLWFVNPESICKSALITVMGVSQ